MLILSQIKVCYAQRAHVDKPDEDLPAKRLYTEEKLRDFNNMASTLPYPLAIWLESIGNAVDGRQIITPLLAEKREQTTNISVLSLMKKKLFLCSMFHIC
jgi:hypothetical protein